MKRTKITISTNHLDNNKSRVVIIENIANGGGIAYQTGNYITHEYGDGYIDIEKYIASRDQWKKIYTHVFQRTR